MAGLDGQGTKYVAGASVATHYPTDGKGAATATNTSSALATARAVALMKVVATIATTSDAFSVVDGAGTDVPGMTFKVPNAAGNFIWDFGPEGVIVTADAAGGTSTCNLGLKITVLGVGGSIQLHYKVLAP